MTEQEAYIAFNLTDRIGSVGVGRLVGEAGDVVTAWERYSGKESRSGKPIDWNRELELAGKYGVKILTPADADYPVRLLEIAQHPLALYVKGEVSALSRPSIAIVGTRRATVYGTDQAGRLGYELAKSGWMVLSGLALGIDGEAHRGALNAGGVTVGVLGSGLDRFYPEQNRELAREMVKAGGAVVTQFPFGREPDRETFPIRNHVVAALAGGVLAVECPLKSGTLITTSLAADLGRTVMAVPSRVDSRMGAGCLQLIRDGAVLIRNAADVNEAMGELFPRRSAAETGARTDPDRRPRQPAVPVGEITLEESMVLRHVDIDGVTLDKLVMLSGLEAGKVSSLCMGLRLKGRLRYLPGNRVCLSAGFAP